MDGTGQAALPPRLRAAESARTSPGIPAARLACTSLTSAWQDSIAVKNATAPAGAAAGFDSAVTYRHHFARAMRTSPTAYRRAFHTSHAAQPG